MSITYQSKFDGVTIVTDSRQRYTLSNLAYIDGGKDGEVFKLNNQFAVKMYPEYPINSSMREKLSTLCGQRGSFHELVVAPLQMVRLEGQPTNQAAGFIMKYLPDAKPLNCMSWKPSITNSEETLFDQMIANLIYEISEALENLHANRVFMCDLKPQNILISNLKPYLIDFDSCSIPNYPGESFTIPYLDPRIRDHVPDAVGPNEEFSALTDWWALAVIAFELFMGVSPWAGIHPKYRKEPHVFRSYNYSVVVLDPMVQPPKFDMRNPKWLESKSKLKTYFKKIFSPDPASRVPLFDVLDAHFPREESLKRAERASNLMARLIQDDRQRQFLEKLWTDMIEKARKKTVEREKSRIRLLDMMYSA